MTKNKNYIELKYCCHKKKNPPILKLN